MLMSNKLLLGAGLALPTFSDNFNRADDTALATGNPSWTLLYGNSGSLRVISNALVMSGSTASGFASPSMGSPDHWAECTLLSAAGNISQAFLNCRFVSANSRIYATASGSSYFVVVKMVAGTSTVLGQTVTNGSDRPAAGKVIRLSVKGDTVNFTVDGVNNLGPLSLGGTNTTGNNPGVQSATAAVSPWIDDYKTGAL